MWRQHLRDGLACSTRFRSTHVHGFPSFHRASTRTRTRKHSSQQAPQALSSITMDASILERFGIGDAHCHPQDDPVDCSSRLRSLSAPFVAVMGTRWEDWPAVEQLAREAPTKVIPCFGVHPWFAHRHALEAQTGQQEQHPQQSKGDKASNSSTLSSAGAAADAHAAAPASSCTLSPAAAATAALLDAPSNGRDSQDRHPQLLEQLTPVPAATWLPALRELLVAHPEAVVGEFGMDRAAVVPGTKLQPSWSHQLSLTRLHLFLAAELSRPVSLHCVRGYGHLADMLRQMGPEGCPPAIMLHSYGGSLDMIKTFTKLPGGVGDRVYFSFSAVINGRAREQLYDRLRAVPLDRLLLESDQNSPVGVDNALCDVLGAVAEARGLQVEEVAEAAGENFRRFYASSLAHMATG